MRSANTLRHDDRLALVAHGCDVVRAFLYYRTNSSSTAIPSAYFYRSVICHCNQRTVPKFNPTTPPPRPSSRNPITPPGPNPAPRPTHRQSMQYTQPRSLVSHLIKHNAAFGGGKGGMETDPAPCCFDARPRGVTPGLERRKLAGAGEWRVRWLVLLPWGLGRGFVRYVKGEELGWGC